MADKEKVILVLRDKKLKTIFAFDLNSIKIEIIQKTGYKKIPNSSSEASVGIWDFYIKCRKVFRF
ncbi:hypothetical protein BXU01_10750 [[Flexibacter] sp. ATCC 35103]|nr:hypothetical protein BXU01_10750 [[Flexibacter] sp. ATCC 35103]